MRSMITQVRVGAGVPAGGQYASHDRAEASIALAEPEPANARTPLDPKVAMRFAHQVAAGKAARFMIYDNETLDDITQNAVLSVLGSMSRDRVNGLTGGLIANAVHHAISAAISERTGVHRPEDVKALRLLEAQVEAFTHEHGREPSAHERDELAQRIRDAWPDPRHRPLRGYQARVIHEVLAQSRDAQNLAGGVDPAEEHDGSEALRELEEELNTGYISKDLARLRLWNAIAKAEGLPLINRRLPPGTNASKCIRAVTAAGGPLAVAKQYVSNGEITPQVEALLYPFDIRSRDDAIDIARLLVSRGNAALMLWKAATNAAAHPKVY